MAYIKFQGMSLSLDDGAATPAAVPIEQISGIDGLSATTSVNDRTVMNSTAIEKSPGLPDYGNLTIDLFYDPSLPGHSNLRDAAAAQDIREGVLTFADGQTATFQCFVSQVPSLSGSANTDFTGQAILEITGSPVFA
ncbi:MAG: hypothetical protein R3215_02170 [Halomonas sp.]|nr:hypothetical protein [Halomonas sp.]